MHPVSRASPRCRAIECAGPPQLVEGGFMIWQTHQMLPFPNIHLIWLSPSPPSLIVGRPASGLGEATDYSESVKLGHLSINLSILLWNSVKHSCVMRNPGQRESFTFHNMDVHGLSWKIVSCDGAGVPNLLVAVFPGPRRTPGPCEASINVLGMIEKKKQKTNPVGTCSHLWGAWPSLFSLERWNVKTL